MAERERAGGPLGRRRPDRGPASRGGAVHPFREGLAGIGWVVLVSVVITLVGAAMAAVVSLGY